MEGVLSESCGEQLAMKLYQLCRAHDEEQRDAFVAANGHLVLIGLLSAGPDTRTTFFAIHALLQLVRLREDGLDISAYKWALPLVQANAAAPVVALLRAPMADKDSLRIAASLLALLTMEPSGKEAALKAGAIAALVPLLSEGHDAATIACATLCSLGIDGDSPMTINLTEIRQAGAIPKLVALLHDEGGAMRTAANTLRTLIVGDEQSAKVVLAALASRPPPRDDQPEPILVMMLDELRPTATERLTAAEAGDDVAALQQAIDQAAAVRVADAELQPARARLAAIREAAEAARRERRTSLGLDELKTPDEFVCPITFEVMQDPVCASDGHTYERSAVEEVLALPEESRRSPLTREPLQATLFPNRALKNRIAAFEQEVEAAAERAAQKAVEAERTSVASRKRSAPAGAAEDSSDAGASSSSEPASSKRGRRK
mgnify:CR=1 FL=1|tara:strand:+ start:1336 stop:2634 length:1299 start_codon:yes stop_codon:yes gene_type:complete